MTFRFSLRVKPNARRESVGGDRLGALVVAVAAPAVEGKANEAVRAIVAKAFGVRRGDVAVVAGHRGRDKIIELDPAPADAADRLARLLAAEAGRPNIVDV